MLINYIDERKPGYATFDKVITLFSMIKWFFLEIRKIENHFRYIEALFKIL